MNKQIRVISAVFALLLLWQIGAVMIDNDWVMPFPKAVGLTMLKQLQMSLFYESVIASLLRGVIGLGLAFVFAFICAYAAYTWHVFRELFYPILLLTRSVPNISFIILVLVWFGSEKSSAIVSFLILFPTIYSSLYYGFTHIDERLQQVIQLYPKKRWYLLRKIYIPLLAGPMQAAFSNGISLAFKIGVMAEIVGQVQVGIGRQLNVCRLQSDMTGIFAWTAWMILIMLCMELCIQLLYGWKKKKQLQ